MKTMLVFMVVVVGIFVYLNYRTQDASVELTEAGTIKHTHDFEVRFNQKALLSDTFMIFGGHIDRKLPNSFSDYSLGALAIADASLIQKKYPDFHQCKSLGAPLAQQKIRNMALIMENPQAAEVVEDSISLHSERLVQDGERTCIQLHGHQLEPASIQLREDGRDISNEILPKLRNVDYYLIDGAEIKPCLSLL